MDFERCMERLEEIVRQMGDREVTLDQSLKLYEEGVRLGEQALALLEAGEGRVAVLQKRMEDLFSKEADRE